jgi:YidC/Oxa1 family membrane protein insertase
VIGSVFHSLFELIAKAIVVLHKATGPVFGKDSGLSWALAIVLLTVAVRGVMYPLFVKQIKTQRAMQVLQPKIKELQKKHKGDKETLNTEMMKLYKEHNANPLAGCAPMLLQMPIFIALFQVLNQLAPKIDAKTHAYYFPDKFDLPLATRMSLEKAKLFGAPIGAGLSSPAKLLTFLGASSLPVKIVAGVLVVAMAATTFITSKQMMAKNGPSDPSQATQQKVLLYVMPGMLALFGLRVAIGTLIYWTTTNLFSMAQQSFVMRRLGPVGATAGGSGSKAAAPAPKPTPKPKPKPVAATADAVPDEVPLAAPHPPQNRRPNNRNTKRGKNRRGGRR